MQFLKCLFIFCSVQLLFILCQSMTDGHGGSIDLNQEDEYKYGKPFPVEEQPNENSTIFVSIASYRDGKRCGFTLYSLFKEALNPFRVFPAVVEQNEFSVETPDPNCIIEYCKLALKDPDFQGPQVLTRYGKACPYLEQISHLQMDWRYASGPIYPRALAERLKQNQEYCLQVDSHSQAMAKWDQILLEEWASTENEYAVLSTYIHPMTANIEEMAKRTDIPILCKLDHYKDAEFGSFFRNGVAHAAWNLKRPKIGKLWAAGFSFAKCHVDDTVPYDPTLKFVWDGEELGRMIRMWTFGYDVYAPVRNALFHDYNSATNKFDWMANLDENQRALRRQNLAKAAAIQSGNVNQHLVKAPYGFGRCRSHRQYLEWSGFDADNLIPPTGAAFCYNLTFKPYAKSCLDDIVDMFKSNGRTVSGPFRKVEDLQQQLDVLLAFQRSADAKIGDVRSEIVALANLTRVISEPAEESRSSTSSVMLGCEIFVAVILFEVILIYWFLNAKKTIRTKSAKDV